MNLAVFHYHLQPGGVTDVIIDSVRAVCLQGARIGGEPVTGVTLVCGRADNVGAVVARITGGESDETDAALTGPSGPIRVTTEVQPLLDYTDASEPLESAIARADEIERWLVATYADAAWWIHNYHLGKNPSFTRAVCRIAASDESAPPRILLHIHDFPESARYENLAYLRRVAGSSPYPAGPNVRYAAINPHDYRALLAAGIPGSQAALLLNPLPGGQVAAGDSAGSPAEDRDELVRGLANFADATGQRFHPDRPILLYPVRTIRRKNVLEAGAIARLFPEANLVTTLPGTSEAERPYSELVSFAYSERRIHGIWGIGRREAEFGLSFARITRGADAVVSSSVQEGFGLTFVNALIWQKPLVARHLEVLEGIDALFAGYPASFYQSFLVPTRSPSVTAMGPYLRMRYQERLDEIGDALPEDLRPGLEEEIDALVAADTVDFSFLPPQLQLTVLGDLRDSGFGSYVRALNGEIFTSLEHALGAPEPPAMAGRLEEHLGYEGYAKAFAALMEGAGPGDASEHSFSGAQAALMRAFATLSRLRLILGPLDHDAHHQAG